jgi:hypothetical protein
MTDYIMGILVGGLLGYCFSLATMMVIWSLCVIAKKADEGQGYYGKDKTDFKEK